MEKILEIVDNVKSYVPTLIEKVREIPTFFLLTENTELIITEDGDYLINDGE
jgi:hypothetical protein